MKLFHLHDPTVETAIRDRLTERGKKLLKSNIPHRWSKLVNEWVWTTFLYLLIPVVLLGISRNYLADDQFQIAIFAVAAHWLLARAASIAHSARELLLFSGDTGFLMHLPAEGRTICGWWVHALSKEWIALCCETLLWSIALCWSHHWSPGLGGVFLTSILGGIVVGALIVLFVHLFQLTGRSLTWLWLINLLGLLLIATFIVLNTLGMNDKLEPVMVSIYSFLSPTASWIPTGWALEQMVAFNLKSTAGILLSAILAIAFAPKLFRKAVAEVDKFSSELLKIDDVPLLETEFDEYEEELREVVEDYESQRPRQGTTEIRESILTGDFLTEETGEQLIGPEPVSLPKPLANWLTTDEKLISALFQTAWKSTDGLRWAIVLISLGYLAPHLQKLLSFASEWFLLSAEFSPVYAIVGMVVCLTRSINLDSISLITDNGNGASHLFNRYALRLRDLVSLRTKLILIRSLPFAILPVIAAMLLYALRLGPSDDIVMMFQTTLCGTISVFLLRISLIPSSSAIMVLELSRNPLSFVRFFHVSVLLVAVIFVLIAWMDFQSKDELWIALSVVAIASLVFWIVGWLLTRFAIWRHSRCRCEICGPT